MNVMKFLILNNEFPIEMLLEKIESTNECYFILIIKSTKHVGNCSKFSMKYFHLLIELNSS